MNRKVIFPLLVLFIFCSVQTIAQGKYAGAFKSLIGRSFTDEKHVGGLPGYKFMQGDMITDVNDAQAQFIDVYVKEASGVIWRATFVYGEPKTDRRHIFLGSLALSQGPVAVTVGLYWGF